jgi:sulfate adenylyltransferase large subunit
MAAVLPLEPVNALDLFLAEEGNKELLRFTTAGSVDDGKSTLIGRLLYDSKSVYEDQLDSVKKSRINRSGKAIDFSLLTDGLRAEREQGITIDVAYRFFSTPRRKFIIADTPGHEQYTRNMATGASTADLAVILIDASKGLLPQTRRHAYIASLLGITRVLAAVNKMDLVAFREEVFLRLQDDFSELAMALGISSIQCVPVSALDGDNVVARSEKTPWYSGPTLLEHLETVPLGVSSEKEDVRFPVQTVIRPDARFRGFAGRVAGGTLRPGDEVLALPSKQQTRVESILGFDGNLEAAGPGQSVVLKLAREIDLSRGDLLVSPNRPPHISRRFLAMVVWLHETPLELHRSYLAKHTGRQVKVKATRISYRVDVNQLTQHPADRLQMNEIAAVEFEASQTLCFDPYPQNRTTGSLILIDPLGNATVGAVMIREELPADSPNGDRAVSSRAAESRGKVAVEERIGRHGHSPGIVVLTGERSLAEFFERQLWAQGLETVLIHRGEIRNSDCRAYLTGLWNLGLVIISWAETPVRLREKRLFSEIAGESVFDLSSADVQAQARMDWSEVSRIAESLRSGGSRIPSGGN